MNRREFLALSLSSTTLALPRSHPHKPSTTFSILKGAHLAQGFDPNLINALGLDSVVGVDGIIEDVYGGQANYLGSLNAEYIHRVPDGWLYDYSINAVRNAPQFKGKWEIWNEPNLWGISPQEAASATVHSWSLVRTTNPSPNDYFVLSAGAQDQTYAYLDAMLTALPVSTLSQINAIGFHIYPSTLDPNEVKTYLRGARGVMNRHGLNNARGWITEIGFVDSSFTVAQIAAYVPQLFSTLSSFTWLERIHWYLAQSDVNNYVGFGVNKLNAVGRAYRDL